MGGGVQFTKNMQFWGAMLSGKENLSFLTKDRTHAPCSGNMES